jgi:transposase
VHARSVVAGVIDQRSGAVRSLRLPSSGEATIGWWETVPGRVVYEAGQTGYGRARACAEAGISCAVAAPSRVRAAADRVKTDRRDAERLARLLRLGEITPVRIPTLEQEAARDRVRAREDARGDLMGGADHNRGHLEDSDLAQHRRCRARASAQPRGRAEDVPLSHGSRACRLGRRLASGSRHPVVSPCVEAGATLAPVQPARIHRRDQ